MNCDEGREFRRNEYIEFVKGKNMGESMEGKGRWVDNVVIEGWFGRLKRELIYMNE